MLKGWRSIFIILSLVLLGLVVYLTITDYFDPLVQSFIFKIEAPESTSYTGRIDQFNYFITSILNPENWLFGIASNTFEAFDSQYYNLFINNGIFVLLLYLAIPCYVIFQGFKYNKKIAITANMLNYAIYLIGVIFVLLITIFTANFTAFMQRYPMNMYYYLFIAIILKDIADIKEI